MRDLVKPGDFVVLVVPIDSAAPKGRLILPQQQTIRDLLDAGTTAIVRHLFDADTNDNNKPGHVTLKIMTVWQKQGSKWILLARQAVKPPVQQ